MHIASTGLCIFEHWIKLQVLELLEYDACMGVQSCNPQSPRQSLNSSIEFNERCRWIRVEGQVYQTSTALDDTNFLSGERIWCLFLYLLHHSLSMTTLLSQQPSWFSDLCNFPFQKSLVISDQFPAVSILRSQICHRTRVGTKSQTLGKFRYRPHLSYLTMQNPLHLQDKGMPFGVGSVWSQTLVFGIGLLVSDYVYLCII